MTPTSCRPSSSSRMSRVPALSWSRYQQFFIEGVPSSKSDADGPRCDPGESRRGGRGRTGIPAHCRTRWKRPKSSPLCATQAKQSPSTRDGSGRAPHLARAPAQRHMERWEPRVQAVLGARPGVGGPGVPASLPGQPIRPPDSHFTPGRAFQKLPEGHKSVSREKWVGEY